MTLLSSPAPTLRAEDSFRLVYHGSYTETVYDKAKGVITLKKVKGPLPYAKFVWNGEDYLGGLEPGQARLVPFDVIRLFFGDPRSVPNARGRTEDKKGNIGDIAPREHEIRRLATIYGLYEANAGRLGEAVPDVTITTGDDIEVICPATDPDGHHIYGYATETAEVHDIATQLANMKAQIRLLEDAARAEAKQGGKNDGADVATDGPPMAK